MANWPTQKQIPSSNGSPWNLASRVQANEARVAKREAQTAVTKSELRMLQAELRKREVGQLLVNTEELMEYAMNLAGDDEGKLGIFVNIVMGAIRNEQRIFERQHDPLLQRYLQ